MKLIIENLNKRFDQHHVLNDVNFSFEQGKIYGLLGRNGSGKTTLFNCISQEIKCDSGRIYFDDNQDITNQDVGFVYTTPMLPDFMTGYEFMVFFADIHESKGLNRNDIDVYFDRIQFTTDDRHRLIKDYSTGMKNKLQMLCLILIKPKILLLDEPLTSFDVVASMEMKKELINIKESCIMILSTHILQIATDICDKIVILHNGQLEELEVDRLSNEEFEAEIMEKLNHESQ
ncbi:ATP-binding cassette domain-containing protein [Erysipelothrix urinaevulpis]|uniref:ABC transporter ATP-binding protein n=1 Tax=Erysipelothrix urinaevulpis TaxID=2683717 RepID=UPI00135C3E81|nr:ABC transporter ATP-binding protein [Erysipelothrix urinaevulpis]